MEELAELGMILLGPPEDEAVWQERSRETWEKLYKSFGGEEWVRKANHGPITQTQFAVHPQIISLDFRDSCLDTKKTNSIVHAGVKI